MIVYLILIAGFAGGAWYYWKYQRLRETPFNPKPTISDHIVVGSLWGVIGVLVACVFVMILLMLGAFD